MKTLRSIFLSAVIGCALITACKKDPQDMAPIAKQQIKDNVLSGTDASTSSDFKNWRDDFDTPNSLEMNWILYGSALPKWVPFAANRYGLFDNNGRLPNGSFAVSKARIGNGQGYTIESAVYINVSNTAVPAIIPEIGVTRYLIQTPETPLSEAGISMKLAYVGTSDPRVPVTDQDHTFLQMSVLRGSGNFISSGNYELPVNKLSDGWHIMKIVVNANREVSFYLDNQLVWSPQTLIDESLMRDKNVILGFSSGGNNGQAYHDWVRVIYPPSPGQLYNDQGINKQ
jgi:hypothetical protein